MVWTGFGRPSRCFGHSSTVSSSTGTNWHPLGPTTDQDLRSNPGTFPLSLCFTTLIASWRDCAWLRCVYKSNPHWKQLSVSFSIFFLYGFRGLFTTNPNVWQKEHAWQDCKIKHISMHSTQSKMLFCDDLFLRYLDKIIRLGFNHFLFLFFFYCIPCRSSLLY